MTTKDYIYLGLLLLTALLFYSNGFYDGVRRARSIYYGKLIDRLEKETEEDDEPLAPPPRQRLRRYGESHESPYSNN